MNWLYLPLAAASALAFYLATAHQQLWLAARARPSRVRALAWALAVAALAVAMLALGTWAGVFSALTAFMLVAVALPWIDVARRLRRERRHVG
ncbi:hypothetical protein ARC20_03965 [Stenotrophomonas panacihumi]|uniref:Uncharacterized protein n=1 Tax=Stenotrophomonas panacihumi TaxID=676599 RepID=A0A0R0ANI1_9GAMM|nr:hypothetical protein [Stenotrophomonas panacihumi]KRG46838.1 hypothetical protein ARC20_03965 [Stenotrophomonas panacihumi]PTN55971.1 hypothetical protein C9J98_02540 [Stenotrophomonas panacihumi]